MATGTLSLEHGSRRTCLVQALLKAIFSAELEPGQRLRLERLAAQFEVSVTPIREALVELAGIGVVELQQNRGAVLRPFGPKELREIIQIRRIFECEATRSVCQRIAPGQGQDLELRFQELQRQFVETADAPRNSRWSARTRELDTELHELIAAECGSGRLAYEIGRYAVIFRVLRDTRHEHRNARANYEQMDENSEHLRIVGAILAGDPDQAAAEMAYHINQSAKVLEQDLFSDRA